METTTNLVYIPDYDEVSFDRLLDQYADKPRWRALLGGIAAGHQLMEDLFFNLLVDGTLDAASGDRLDQWGAIVGESRLGLPDDDYRLFIQARILVNKSGGTADELIAIFELITRPSIRVHLFNLPPACFSIQVDRFEFMTDARQRRVVNMMVDAKPAGVCMSIVEAAGAYFGFEGDPDAMGYSVGTYARRLL